MPTKRKADDGNGPEAATLEFLRNANRPYSIAEIGASLGGDVGKTAVLKALNSLVEDDLVHSKTYNKQVVYVIKQQDTASKLSPEEQKAREDKVRKLKESTAKVLNENQTLTKELAAFKNQETVQALHAEIDSLKKLVHDDQERLTRINSAVLIDPKDLERVDADYKKYRALWSKRKRMFDDVWDTMSQNMDDIGKSKQAERKYLEENYDIEFDSVDFKLDPLIV